MEEGPTEVVVLQNNSSGGVQSALCDFDKPYKSFMSALQRPTIESRVVILFLNIAVILIIFQTVIVTVYSNKAEK